MATIKELSAMPDTEFENLTFDLVLYSGLKNATWRTPGADGGRDIEGVWLSTDLSQQIRQELWYVECKRYKASVSWPTVFEKIAYASTAAADVLMLVTSSALSPNCKNEIAKWNAAKRRPLIQYLDGARLAARVSTFPTLLAKYGLGSAVSVKGKDVRGVLAALVSACDAAEGELDDRAESISSDAAFELARLVGVRSEEISLYGKFAESFGRSVPVPAWCENSTAEKLLPSNVRVLLAYFRFVVRPKRIKLISARMEKNPAFEFEIEEARFPSVGSFALDEVAIWCAVRINHNGPQLTLESK